MKTTHRYIVGQTVVPKGIRTQLDTHKVSKKSLSSQVQVVDPADSHGEQVVWDWLRGDAQRQEGQKENN